MIGERKKRRGEKEDGVTRQERRCEVKEYASEDIQKNYAGPARQSHRPKMKERKKEN
jgi:hypothetical protein